MSEDGQERKNEQDIYDRVCKPAFQEIKTDVKAILNALKGDAERPDQPGMCERLRTLEKEHKAVRSMFKWAVIIIGGTWLTQNSITFIEWLAKILAAKPHP